MPCTHFTGLSPEQILANDHLDDSSRHFGQAASWIDYLLRTMKPSAVHYAAIQLRYGIEYLLCELLVLSGKVISEQDYLECLGNAFGSMKGKLGEAGVKYEKLAKFTNRVLCRNSALRLTEWDIGKLSHSWGTASNFLHFCGSHERTYRQDAWLISAIAKLQDALKYPLEENTTKAATPVMRPDGMEPEIHAAWIEFEAGSLSISDLDLRLNLIDPALLFRHTEIISRDSVSR